MRDDNIKLDGLWMATPGWKYYKTLHSTCMAPHPAALLNIFGLVFFFLLSISLFFNQQNEFFFKFYFRQFHLKMRSKKGVRRNSRSCDEWNMSRETRSFLLHLPDSLCSFPVFLEEKKIKINANGLLLLFILFYLFFILFYSGTVWRNGRSESCFLRVSSWSVETPPPARGASGETTTHNW